MYQSPKDALKDALIGNMHAPLLFFNDAVHSEQLITLTKTSN